MTTDGPRGTFTAPLERLCGTPTIARGVMSRDVRQGAGVATAATAVAAGPALYVSPALASAPLNYLFGYGDKAYPVVALTWGVTVIAAAVVAIVTLLVAGAIWRRPGLARQEPGTQVELRGPEGGAAWIWIGVGISSLVLLVSIVWTMRVLAQVTSPPTPAALTIEVTGTPMVVAGPLSERRSVAHLHHRQRNSHSHRRAGAVQADRRRRDPFLLGARAWPARPTPFPARPTRPGWRRQQPGIYRGQCTEYCGVAARPYGAARGRRAAGRISRPGGTISCSRPRRRRTARSQRAAGFQHALRRLPCGARHRCGGHARSRSQPSDDAHNASRPARCRTIPPISTRWISDPQGVKPGSADADAGALARTSLPTSRPIWRR